MTRAKVDEVNGVLLHLGHLNWPVGMPLELVQEDLLGADWTGGVWPVK